MMKARALLIVVAATLLSSGCAVYNLQRLRNTTPRGTAFQTKLSQLYMEFATAKEKRYDWYNSMYFAGKGLQAAYGKDVEPENLAEWNIPAENLDDMEKARAMLMTVLTEPQTTQHPDLTAKAQVEFDCWVEYQEADWQWDDINECRDGLADALRQLTGIGLPTAPPHAKTKSKAKTAVKPVAAATPTPTPTSTPLPEQELASTPTPAPAAEQAAPTPEPPPAAPAPVASAPASEKESYVLFFKDGESGLSEAGNKVLDEVIGSLGKTASYQVELKNGVDDKASKKIDPVLAQKRADTVTQRLVAGGIKADAIMLTGFGDASIAKTKPVTHRVVIYLNE